MNFTRLKTAKHRLLSLGLIAVSLLCFGPCVALGDTIHLKDGTVIEGDIEQEAETYIWVVVKIGSLEQKQLIPMSQIERIERDSPAPDKHIEATSNVTRAPALAEESREKAISEGATKVAFISLRDGVGKYLNAGALLRATERFDEDEQPDIVVLVINSPGGALFEVQKLSDAIHEQLKSKYRVVAWVESAISAACMTTWNCEEIYMTHQAPLGGNVAFSRDDSGRTTAASGADLEVILKMGEELSRRGNHDPLVMRAMQQFMTLSCDIDENGNVTWYDDDRGEIMVSPEDRILTLNSVDAVKYHIARAVADTKEELLRAMGVTEWVEVGQDAEEYMVQFRADVKKLDAQADKLFTNYQTHLTRAQSGDEDTRNRSLGRARLILRQLRGMVRRAPSFAVYTPLNDEWFAEQERLLRTLAKDGE